MVTSPGAHSTTGEADLVRVLLGVATVGVDDHAMGVFLRCWAKERRQSSAEAAAALARASARLTGVADAGRLATVNRWIEVFVPQRERSPYGDEVR